MPTLQIVRLCRLCFWLTPTFMNNILCMAGAYAK